MGTMIVSCQQLFEFLVKALSALPLNLPKLGRLLAVDTKFAKKRDVATTYHGFATVSMRLLYDREYIAISVFVFVFHNKKIIRSLNLLSLQFQTMTLQDHN